MKQSEEMNLFFHVVLFQTRFRLIRKSDGESVSQVYEADPMFFFHTSNAYEENGCVVLDLAAYTDDQALKCSALENYKIGDEKKEGYCPIPCAYVRRYVLPLNVDNQKVCVFTKSYCIQAGQ